MGLVSSFDCFFFFFFFFLGRSKRKQWTVFVFGSSKLRKLFKETKILEVGFSLGLVCHMCMETLLSSFSNILCFALQMAQPTRSRPHRN